MLTIKYSTEGKVGYPAYLKLTEMVKDPVDLLKVASKLGVSPSTIRKIIERRPISRYIEVKVHSVFRSDPHLSSEPEKPSVIDKMIEVNRLYLELETLRAVGEKVGLSRERVRQLLTKGSAMGLFNYRPVKRFAIPKEKILSDYKKFLKLNVVAKVNNISLPYLQKLRIAYKIKGQELADVRAASWRAQCIETYHCLAQELGHYPTTTELQRMREGRYLQVKIRKLWGSFSSFLKALKFPNPSYKSTRVVISANQRLASKNEDQREKILQKVVGLSNR
ncbi:MAG: hypothetical protein ABGX83_07250 [Nitrospira sp.]|nr:hypothetical protein [Candidatus Manganitrophaceae bacterium]HIL35497.1 hypothetical protein [Candidatus Manganitrophaceae bacterium]